MNIGVIFLMTFIVFAFILFFTEGSIYFKIEDKVLSVYNKLKIRKHERMILKLENKKFKKRNTVIAYKTINLKSKSKSDDRKIAA